MESKFRPGQYVFYQNNDVIEIGRITRVGETSCFVCYSEGETAACTPYDCIYPIVNEYVIQDTTLGGVRFKDIKEGDLTHD